MKKFYIKTYGCQMNVNDSEKMAGILLNNGYEHTEDIEDSDIIIINTCAVREKSQEKLFSFLGRLKNWKDKKFGRKIIVTGCVAQLFREKIKKRANYVDSIIGTSRYYRILEALESKGYFEDTRLSKDWIEVEYKNAMRHNGFSAYVSIMEGCDSFCTYCVVPYTRGRERFRGFHSIIEEINFLYEQGFKEVQLLGQNVDSYVSPDEKIGLPELLEMIVKETDIAWIRFLTSHPAKFSLKTAEVMAKYKRRILPTLHIPFQAGSTKVLNLMNRGYTKEEYLKLIKEIREIYPEVSLSTDVIVGFPQEEENDFKDTLDILERVKFENIYSFAYSPRPGTKALKFGDPIPFEEKMRRLHIVQELQKRIQLELNREYIGKIIKVLTDGINRHNEFTGRSERGRVINFSGNTKIGEFSLVKIKSAGPFNLRGIVKS